MKTTTKSCHVDRQKNMVFPAAAEDHLRLPFKDIS